MVAVPTGIYPATEQLLQIGKEAVAATAPAQAAFVSVPIAGFLPDNKTTPLEDNSFWGDMVKTHDLQLGPIWQEGDISESPVYGDTFPHFLLNLMGDLTTTGTAGSPSWTSSSAITAGAGPIAVTSASSAVAGTFIQIDSLTNSEVVKVGTGSTATSIVIDASTPIRFAHLTATAIVTVSAPFTHTISLLNPGSSTGITTGQPPSHTFIHRTNIPGSGNNSAWQFAYGCMSEITLSGKASGVVTWSGKVTSYKRAYPTFLPVASFSSVRMIPAWKGGTTIASAAANNLTDWTLTLTREIDPEPTADGVQDPYAIVRGAFGAAFKLTYNVAIDEGPLNHVLSNDQPTFAWTINNGGSGAGLVSMGVNAQLMGFKDAPLKVEKSLFGWEANGDLIGATQVAGNSGGRSPLSLTFQNAIPTY